MAVASCYGHFFILPFHPSPSPPLNPKQTKAAPSTLHPSSSSESEIPSFKTHDFIVHLQTENKRNIQKTREIYRNKQFTNNQFYCL